LVKKVLLCLLRKEVKLRNAIGKSSSLAAALDDTKLTILALNKVTLFNAA